MQRDGLLVLVKDLSTLQLESKMMFGVAIGVLVIYTVSLFVHRFIGV